MLRNLIVLFAKTRILYFVDVRLRRNQSENFPDQPFSSSVIGGQKWRCFDFRFLFNLQHVENIGTAITVRNAMNQHFTFYGVYKDTGS